MKANIVRGMRFALREGLRNITTSARVGDCGRPIGRSNVMVKARDGRAYFAGVATCASVWACPACSARIRAKRADELGAGLIRHLDAGGGVAMLTLTVRHHMGDDLAELIKTLTTCWKSILQHWSFRRVKKEYGVVGFVRSLEVTYGENGWHPHLHVLVLFERPQEELSGLTSVIRHLWGNSAAMKFGRDAAQTAAVDLRALNGTAAGLYVSKLQDPEHWRGVGMEVASLDTKTRGGTLPFEILAAAIEGDPKSVGLWRTWESASFGRRALQYSSGLRAVLGIDSPEDDAALLEGDEGPEIIDVLSLSAEHYRGLLKRREAATLLDAVEFCLENNLDPRELFGITSPPIAEATG